MIPATGKIFHICCGCRRDTDGRTEQVSDAIDGHGRKEHRRYFKNAALDESSPASTKPLFDIFEACRNHRTSIGILGEDVLASPL
jgi:hypothetical protein